MAERSEHIAYLWQQYITDKATPEELEELFRLNREAAGDEEQDAIIEQLLARYPAHRSLDREARESMLQQILRDNSDEAMSHSPVHRVHFLRRWGWAAASVLVLLAAAGYYWFAAGNKQASPVARTMDIAPGKSGAILTLADGSTVVLDSLGNGEIARQTGATIMLKDGQLAYDPTGEGTVEATYNTMSTPRGRQFQVVLPDGTNAWLNAASSIRYPTVFTGREREVAITGEVYFEVAKDAGKPFRVKVNDLTEIEVAGTHFNVNAYTEEPAVSTTLLEGAVRVVRLPDGQPGSVTLKPGQQAQIDPAKTGIKLVKDANTAQVIAWKNGVFSFEGLPFQEAMRQLERWYDIKVSYENGVPGIHFWGEIGRDVSLNGVLKMLEGSKLKFRIEADRKLVILN